MSGIGPTLPTWALQQVVGYRGYSGRDANVVAEAALDPSRTASVHRIMRGLPNGVACQEVVAISVVMLDAGPSMMAIVSAFCH